MKLWTLAAVAFVVIFADSAHAAPNASIEFLFNMNDGPEDGYKLTYGSPKFQEFARKAVKICVSGMWALYNTENYGTDTPKDTTSIVARGESEKDCTDQPVGEIVRTIRSLRPLIVDLEYKASCGLWKNRNFIAESSPALEAALPSTCNPSGDFSAAFPGSPTANTVFQITGSSGICTCLDPKKGHSYIADASIYPTAAKPLNTITKVETPTACLSTCI